MEFPFDVTSILPVDEKGVCLLHGKTLRGNYMVNEMNNRYGTRASPLASIIDTMGKLSAKA
jgi:hypothetical protein